MLNVDKGNVIKVFQNNGITYDRVLRKIETVIGTNIYPYFVDSLKITPRVKKVIELALNEIKKSRESFNETLNFRNFERRKRHCYIHIKTNEDQSE